MLKTVLGAALLLTAWLGAGAAVVASGGAFKPSGDFIDIGGRKLRLVCAGPRGPQPTVWMEAGAFGVAADFSAIQEKLAAKGLRSCAYDRAGMGWSDPGPKPRDSYAIVTDLEKLIAASGEPGPFILMSHSMAGLHLRVFADRNPHQVAGLVLVESATPEQSQSPQTGKFIKTFTMVSQVAAVTGTLGINKFLYYKGDRIGLPPQGRDEKRHAYVMASHARTASNEVVNWARSSAQGRAAKPYDPKWPVAVVVRGGGGDGGWTAARRVPEKASRAGWFENVPAASHTTILGVKHGDAVVRGVEHVLRSLATG